MGAAASRRRSAADDGAAGRTDRPAGQGPAGPPRRGSADRGPREAANGAAADRPFTGGFASRDGERERPGGDGGYDLPHRTFPSGLWFAGPRMTPCSAIAACSDIGGNPEIFVREALSAGHDHPLADQSGSPCEGGRTTDCGERGGMAVRRRRIFCVGPRANSDPGSGFCPMAP
jgi:hypothetical protein